MIHREFPAFATPSWGLSEDYTKLGIKTTKSMGKENKKYAAKWNLVMKTCPLLIVLILLTALLFAQNKTDSNVIIWSPNNKLKWEDFQGKPDSTVTSAAISYTTIFCTYSHEEQRYYSNAIFKRKMSWSKEKYRNSIILSHEQKHFDITEIYSKRLLLALINVSKTHTYGHIYDSVTTEMRSMQKQYDLGTDYSRDYKQQKVWEQKINNMLLEASVRD